MAESVFSEMAAQLKTEAKEWQAELGYIQLQLDALTARKSVLANWLADGERRFSELQKKAAQESAKPAAPTEPAAP